MHGRGDHSERRNFRAEALNGLGETLLAAGQPGEARAQHAAALKAAGQVAYQQARAHAGLASACHSCGDLDQARRHWQQAHNLYTELGVPEADNILVHLAALDDAQPNNENPPTDDTWGMDRPVPRHVR